jgi:hypothetical protein
MAQIVRFPMARPRIVRTKEEAAAVPLHLPIQVEIEIGPLTPTEKMHQALEKLAQAIRLAENKLVLAEQLVLEKEQLRRLTHVGYLKAPLG